MKESILTWVFIFWIGAIFAQKTGSIGPQTLTLYEPGPNTGTVDENNRDFIVEVKKNSSAVYDTLFIY